jgi:CubicO group peptidase (beta-lactamase class C family)
MSRNTAILHRTLAALALGWTAGGAAAQMSLDEQLRPYLAAYHPPALAAAVVKDGAIVAAGAVGTRRVGTQTPVTVNDRFHLGSDTKAMTALLVAMLVEEKKLRWDSTVAEVFPELKEGMDARLRGVTLVQLLSHTSGLPSDNQAFDELLAKAMLREGNLDAMRYWLVQQASKWPLEAEPGQKFAYSNLGYTLAGAVIERAAGKTWDELITERIFIPLELKTAGLGCQSSVGKIDAPLGHKAVDGKVRAFLAGPNGDNPVILGPAGIAHMSVLDFARWAAWNAGEGKRGPRLVRPETLKMLHTPVVALAANKEAKPGTPSDGKYGLGWGEVSTAWAPDRLLFHGGSNELALAHIWVDPRRDVAVVIVTNLSDKKVEEGLLKLASELYTKFAPARGK